MTPSPGKALETGVVFCLCLCFDENHTHMKEQQRAEEARGKVWACCSCAGGRKGKGKTGFGPFLLLLQVPESVASPPASFVLRESHQEGARGASRLDCMRQT